MAIITLGEAKEYLKIEASFTDDDTLITGIIDGVGGYIDKRLNRHLHTNIATKGIPVMPDGYPMLICFTIPFRDGIPETGIYTNWQIYHNDHERKPIEPAKETDTGKGYFLQLDDVSGYIRWSPLAEEEEQIEDRYILTADYSPAGDPPVVPGAIKSAALVLAHSLYSHRTTMFGSDEHNLAEKFLDPYKNLI